MKDVAYKNHLINESSPYLLQHLHNPVDWYPWTDEALEKAKKENKLIIISVGYAACHWCHVMAHESFEDKEVANFTNENFISIKVDREERPDVDQVYMDAVQLMTGSGGWPLNVIALPDGRPVYGGTYFPKERWLEVLKKVLEYVRQNPERAEEVADKVVAGIKTTELIPPSPDSKEFTTDDLKVSFNNWRKRFDPLNGGYSGAPKFPLPSGYMFLLQYHYMTGEKAAMDAVTKTLTKMAHGGIYDQLGGGFARYSTDEHWLVPHFEKMLYDNAQLVSLYASAYQATKEPLYKSIVSETLEFIEREMTSEEGGFYSSIDADSEGDEGRFYVWTKDEIRQITLTNSDPVTDYFNVTEEGNWEEGKNILFRTGNNKRISEKHRITEAELSDVIASAKSEMLIFRSGRVRPGTDDKVLTAWNALMLKGYIDAYRISGEPRFIEKALSNAGFIVQKIMSPDNRLDRNYKNGKSSINGFLDDYAFTSEAFISLYQATFDEKWLQAARSIVDYGISHFYDQQRGMFYYTSDIDAPLITRKIEISDNVIPSANSAMAKNLFLLGKYFDNSEYTKMAVKMAGLVKQDAQRGGTYYANWDILIAWLAKEPFEIAIVGKEYRSMLAEFNEYYLPDVIFSGGRYEGNLPLLKNKLITGKTTIYVCRNKTCKLPVNSVKEAIKQIMDY